MIASPQPTHSLSILTRLSFLPPYLSFPPHDSTLPPFSSPGLPAPRHCCSHSLGGSCPSLLRQTPWRRGRCQSSVFAAWCVLAGILCVPRVPVTTVLIPLCPNPDGKNPAGCLLAAVVIFFALREPSLSPGDCVQHGGVSSVVGFRCPLGILSTP